MPTTLTDPVRLNLGCGRRPLPGYVNVDRERYDDADYNQGIFVQADVFDWLPLALYVDEVRGDQFLEHLTLEEGRLLLRWAKAKLRRGGKLHLSLPDWGAHVADYIERKQRVPLREASIAAGPFRPEVNVMLAIVFGWGHKMFYDEEMLRIVLDETGWVNATIAHPDGANLVVEGVA